MQQEAADNFSFIEPMQVLRVRDLPSGDWLYEMKFDGYRALAFKAGKEVRLLARNRTLFNDNYPVVIDGLKALRAKDFIIDGEVAALDQYGKSSFQLLQSYGIRKQIPLVYYAFDLLSLQDTDLRVQPLIERRKLLAKPVTSIPGYLLQPLRKKTWSQFRKVIHKMNAYNGGGEGSRTPARM
jgi:bifunctional non-homologous end joining protein LigD